jgi:acetyl esterase/lipase
MTPPQHLHPDIAAVVASLLIPDMSDETIALIRSFDIPTELSDAVERTEHRVPGDPEVPLRHHRAKASEGLRPCLYSIHGGGYVIGSYSMDDGVFDRLCPLLDLVGVSVDYRLAPETPYPGPLEDCYRGLKWIFDNAERLGIDRGHIGIGGVSAGGGLAASLGAPRPGPRRGAGRLPTPRLPDARRPADHRVEPTGRPAGVEP